MPSYKIMKSWVKRDSMISREGYILIKIPEHPKSFRGWYYEHRLIMEKKLDRILEVWETIHHVNENKADNRIENLFLCTREQHNKAHK